MAVKTVIAVMTDLFFLVQVIGAAKPLEMKVINVKDKATALEKLKDAPAAFVIDLTCMAADPLTIIAAASVTPGVTTIGFLPHVQTELRQQALDAGCDHVLARSVFAQRLPELLAATLDTDL